MLDAVLPPEDAEVICGDLEEGFHETASRSGRRNAAWWYRRQVLSILCARVFGHGADSHEPSRKRNSMAAVRQDLAFAFRSLRKQPGFTVTAVLMLALGIGANVAIFSLVHAVLLRPLPFAEPDRLMLVHLRAPDLESPGIHRNMIWSYPKYQFLRQHQRTFESVGAFSSWTWNVTGSGSPERVIGEMVDATYFQTLGVGPQLGRPFTTEETRSAGSAPLAILADGFWRRRFGGRTDVIGGTIGLNGIPHEIIGVVPAGFRGLTGQAEVWVPLTTQPAEALAEKWNHSYSVIGRVKPGVSLRQADAETRTLGAVVDQVFPDPMGRPGGFGATAVPLNDERSDPLIRRSILLLLAAVVAVLLIVCINVANLMLVRALGRQREVAIRLALGASRWRIVRQLMTESVLLASLGAVAALAVAYVLVSAGASMLPDLRILLPRGQSSGLTRVGLGAVSVDAGVLLFTGCMALVTAILFGLAPALRASREDLTEAMKTGGSNSVSTGSRGTRVRNLLAAGEIAVALVLLTAGGLLVKSVTRLQVTELGFNPDALIAARVALPAPQYTSERATQFLDQLLSRLAARPEVASVAYGSCPPVSGGCNGTTATFPDRPVAAGEKPLVGVLWASPSYFDVLGIRRVKGRVFTARDRPGQPKVVVINEAAAREFWGSADPIGKRIGVGQGGFGDGAEVIGVVADVRYGEVEKSVKPDVYLPLLQSLRSGGYLFVRGRVDNETLVPALRAEVQAMDPDLPLADVRTMEDRFGDATWRTRMSAWLLGSFAALALLLAALGVYGVMAEGVEQRTREIGVRLALGAARGDILRLVIGRVFAIATAGIALGLVIAIPSMRLLTALLYEVKPSDPIVFAGLTLVLLSVALLAGYLPARRATRVDPLRTLRTE
jgi:putative ABC transport system permease protein